MAFLTSFLPSDTGTSGALSVIAQTVVSGSVAATIDFMSIPATYEDLFIEVMGRHDQASVAQFLNVRLNNDSGANYDWQRLYGQGASPGASLTNGASLMTMGAITGSSGVVNDAGAAQLWIPNYARTVFRKLVRGDAVSSNNDGGSSAVESYMGQWRSTAAVNRVTLFPAAGNWIIGSVATLYGRTSS